MPISKISSIDFPTRVYNFANHKFGFGFQYEFFSNKQASNIIKKVAGYPHN